MADIKISQLGAAIAVEDTDLVPIVSGGNTLKATAALLKRHAIGDDDISDIGDGTPTGAIAALNTELGTTKQALTNHYKKPTVTPSEILLITDSFGQNPTGNVIMGFNLCIGGTCNSIPQGGANYATFATMINGYSGNKDAIKAIIICGGTNERVVADVDSHMAAIKTAADTFPNAIVYFAFMYANFANSGYRALENSILQETINGCDKYGFIFLGNFNDNLYPTYLNIQNDGGHPIGSTGNKLGSAIFNSYLNGVKKALLTTNIAATDSDFGITFNFYVEPDGAIYVRISGTTTANLAPGSYHEIPLDTYYYGDSLPQAIFSDGLIVRGLGYIVLGLRNGTLQYYFVPLPGTSNIPSGTYLDPVAGIMGEIAPKLYKVTNS